MEILIPILTLGILGMIFGVSLTIASKKFSVQADPRLERISDLLPGSNCGACGQAGCFGFAESLLTGKLNPSNCRVSDEQTKQQIAELLGKSLEKEVKKIAILHCNGGIKVKDRFIYQGIEDCISANLVLGGQKECVFGCLGFGSCVKVCPFGAIKMGSEGLPLIDETKCTGCGKCVEACPKSLLSLVPIDKKYFVSCKSRDFGKKVLEVCSVGCIGCRKCEKACPTGAIKVIDNLAIIDYNICENKGQCFKVCPVKCIRKRS